MISMRLKTIFIVVIIIGLTAACGQQEQGLDDVQELAQSTLEPTPQPTPEPAPVEFPFEGIWFAQDRSSMLVITTETVYLHEFGMNREVYARIDGVDLDAETIDVFITAIIMGGMSMGYDTPILQIKYHQNGTVLEFLGQHMDSAPDEEGPVIYILDEFLNSGKQ